MSEQTPRITAPYLDPFKHQIVRIVGKVIQLRGVHGVIDSAGQVTIHLNGEAHLAPQHYCEIIGKVQDDLSVRLLSAVDIGPNIDFAAYEALVDATHRFKEIFYDKDF